MNTKTTQKLAAILLLAAGTAAAQTLPFEFRGVLQSATLLSPADIFSGGGLTAGGVAVTVPRNTIVFLPGSSMSWQQLFAQAPAPYGPTQTGLATGDAPTPLSAYIVHVVGNTVAGTNIAGLVEITTSPATSGQGVISSIDYATGEMRVGGTIGAPATGFRLAINDPNGRYGRSSSPDARFTADPDNPTIRSRTGFPMGLPRTEPATAGDPLVPAANRPLDPITSLPLASFTMPSPATSLATDARFQAPFMVGDFIAYAGTLVQDGPASQYISAHTIIAQVDIFTAPGTIPAYAAVDAAQVGVGSTVGEVLDALAQTRFEGYSTDPTRRIDLFGTGLDPASGLPTDRNWGSVAVDPGPPSGVAKGHWVFQPPAGVTTLPANGVFLPATRTVRAVVDGAWIFGNLSRFANGIVAGQYERPNQYVFPPAGLGGGVNQTAFEKFPFLCKGGLIPTTGAQFVATQLSPWPGSPAPPVCGWPSTPLSNPGPDQTVDSAATVTLNGRASVATPPFLLGWSQLGAPPVRLSAPHDAVTAFQAVRVPFATPPVVLEFALTVTDAFGAFVSTPVRVTVMPEPAVAFSAFAVELDTSTRSFQLEGSFTLGAKSDGIAPLTEAVTVSVGSLKFIIPARSFKKSATGSFTFEGTVGGVRLEMTIKPLAANRYAFEFSAPVALPATSTSVSLTVGNDTGSATVKALPK